MGEDFRIFFVNAQEDGENHSALLEAFQLMNAADHGFNPEWISQEECLSTGLSEKRNSKIFIFNQFDGAGFEHIKGLGYRIYGPRCILSNLQNGLILPRDKKRPIYNLAMNGIKICCTSIDKGSRESMEKLVHLMAGEMARDLTEDVTHLVAGEVGSNKYMVALANKKSVMTKEWVSDVWESSQSKHTMATDEVFNKHKCPCFLGLTVVVSGFNSTERNQIKNFVLKGGGKYSGELKMNECTHLIVKDAKGAKYEAAKNWKIKIVQDKWLYDCMDKGRYLDTKPHEFKKEGKKTKTSTPERLSVAGPHITDVSLIPCAGPDSSMRVANESEMPSSIFTDQDSFSGKTVAESRLGVTGVDIDVTVAPADIFLDGCKIYLSGVQFSVQEKLKKIITSCGGFRATEIKEGVTHVIVDEIIASDQLAISKLIESPHLVSSNWLMDCFAQNSHVGENSYLRSDLDIKKKEKSVPPKFSDSSTPTAEKKPKESHLTLTTNKKSDISVSDKADPVDMEDDLKMDDILSQYTLVENEETLSKDDNADVEILGIDKGNAEENNLEMTQDPNDFNEAVNAGIFHKKTFKFFGLDRDGEEEEALKELQDFIESEGGCVVTQQGKRHQIVDIAIVPLTGFPVDVTVSEVLSVIWLQMCVENGVLVPYDHWLARPMELPEEDVLDGLCICVSGYGGVERNSIMFLAQSLGAMCQDHFARAPTKKVKASTHLIVNTPGGSKYTAAKKWKIPSVGKEWLVACITNKQKVSEEEFDIDILDAKQQEQSDMSVTHLEGNNNTILGRNVNHEEQQSSTSGNKIKVKENVIENEVERSSECRSEVPELPSEKLPTATVESAGAKENIQASSTENAESGTTSHVTTDSSIGIPDVSKKAACRPNQTDNINAAHTTTMTPTTTLMDRRRKKLALQRPIDSPCSTSTPLGLIKGGGETPGTFQHPDFRPKFNLEGIFGVDTPQTARDLNTSTPLGEVFSRQISKAALNAVNLYPDEDMSGIQSQQSELPPLHGVIIAVAKKLGRNHATYNSLVVELGGNYSWQYNDSVTHFVFQGRANDTNKEFRTARDDGKLIVSPYWLTLCHEQGCRVDESLFPHHYNPSQALAMVSSKETPSKSARATRNRGYQGETPSRVANGKTPSKKMPVLNIQEVITKKTESTPSSRKVSNSKKGSETSSSGNDENSSPGKNASKISEVPSENEHQESKTQPQSKMKEPTPPPPTTTTNERVTPSDGVETGPTKTKNKTSEPSSEDMKDALAKTLGTVLEEASRSKKTRKNKGRLAKLSGQLSASGEKTPENPPRTTTPASRSAKEAEKDANQFPEPSQSMQVTWDDPTERLEKEKLAHRLERVCDPSQNTDDYLVALDMPSTLEGFKTGRAATERSPTPEAPSIAFPVPRPTTGVSSPQPVEFLSDESNDGRIANNGVKQTPHFLFSGMQNRELVEYGALVEQLGGKVLEKQHFDFACTHLVVSQPVRNEKYLSCISAGKWVLHKSYLEACRREGKFVAEETHEWGSQYTLSITQNMTAQAFKLASAAHKWRKKVSALKEGNTMCGGAFDGWRVLLCLGRQKEDNFKRILEAGGADVVILRPPFPDTLKVSYGFLDLNKVAIPRVDLAHLICLGIHLVTAEFIAAYLTDDPLPEPSDFSPPEIVTMRASNPEYVQVGHKRRSLWDDDNDGCRSRKMLKLC